MAAMKRGFAARVVTAGVSVVGGALSAQRGQRAAPLGDEGNDQGGRKTGREDRRRLRQGHILPPGGRRATPDGHPDLTGR